MWVKNALRVQKRPLYFDAAEKEKFADMVSDSTLRQICKDLLAAFQSNIKDKYPQLYEKVLKILLSFLTTYLNQSIFSRSVFEAIAVLSQRLKIFQRHKVVRLF